MPQSILERNFERQIEVGFECVPPIDPSPALRRMLEKRLDSYEKLELVLALVETPSRELSIEQLARELQIGTDVLRRLVAALVTAGLVAYADPDGVKLAANATELEVIAEASRLYNDDRAQIVALFQSVALDRIRGMAARSFADAFKIGKKKDPGNG